MYTTMHKSCSITLAHTQWETELADNQYGNHYKNSTMVNKSSENEKNVA